MGHIKTQFHTTFDDNKIIASQLNTLGYLITASTVKDIRLTNGWRHRQVTTEQKTE
jgi:hypothetical protein